MSRNVYSLIGVDLGGTKVAAGIITDGTLIQKREAKINQDSDDPMDAVRLMADLIGQLMDRQVQGIGVGVPGLVNREWGIVYDVLNIPNWKEIPLKALLEEKFDLPIYIDNDAKPETNGHAPF